MEIQKENAMDLPKKLASLRKEKGLSQLDLAERLHVSRQAISRWEVGTAVPNTDNLKYLSQLYGVSVDYLLHDSQEKLPEDAEIPSQTPTEAYWEKKYKQLRRIFIFTLCILFSICILICLHFIHRPEQKRIIPIGELTRDTGDNYPVETFYFHPVG